MLRSSGIFFSHLLPKVPYSNHMRERINHKFANKHVECKNAQSKSYDTGILLPAGLEAKPVSFIQQVEAGTELGNEVQLSNDFGNQLLHAEHLWRLIAQNVLYAREQLRDRKAAIPWAEHPVKLRNVHRVRDVERGLLPHIRQLGCGSTHQG